MTPDKQRDKIDILFQEKCVHERAANIIEAAIGQIQARLCYTRAEALSAVRTYAASAPKQRAPRRQEAHT